MKKWNITGVNDTQSTWAANTHLRLDDLNNKRLLLTVLEGGSLRPG